MAAESTAAHTPGPYRVFKGLLGKGLLGIESLDPKAIERGEEIVVSPCDMNEADARFLAAAPDLLKAIIAAKSYIEGVSEDAPDLAECLEILRRSHCRSERCGVAAMRAREKITLAADATKAMDKLLMSALDDLRIALGRGNGAGVYSDVSAVRSALQNAKVAIAKAQDVVGKTRWPSDEDYDQC